MQISDEKINQIAYEAEKAYAGNPSGIDNTAATYGGLMWFKKDMTGGPDKIEELHLRRPIEIVIGSTGKVANTKAMVEGVAERKKKNPAKYDPIFKQAENVVFAGRKALENYDLKKVGELINENHRLLKKLRIQQRTRHACGYSTKARGFGRKINGRRRRRLHGSADTGKGIAGQSSKRH